MLDLLLHHHQLVLFFSTSQVNDSWSRFQWLSGRNPVTSLLVLAGSHRKMVGFGSRNTVPVSGGRLCSVPVGSLWKREKPATGSGHRIPASMFRSFPEFSGRNRSVRFDLGRFKIFYEQSPMQVVYLLNTSYNSKINPCSSQKIKIKHCNPNLKSKSIRS